MTCPCHPLASILAILLLNALLLPHAPHGCSSTCQVGCSLRAFALEEAAAWDSLPQIPVWFCPCTHALLQRRLFHELILTACSHGPTLSPPPSQSPRPSSLRTCPSRGQDVTLGGDGAPCPSLWATGQAQCPLPMCRSLAAVPGEWRASRERSSRRPGVRRALVKIWTALWPALCWRGSRLCLRASGCTFRNLVH